MSDKEILEAIHTVQALYAEMKAAERLWMEARSTMMEAEHPWRDASRAWSKAKDRVWELLCPEGDPTNAS